MDQTAPRPLFRLQAVQFRSGRMGSGATLRPPLSLAILTAAYLVTRRARLRTAWMRADLMARSRGSGHRRKRAMKS